MFSSIFPCLMGMSLMLNVVCVLAVLSSAQTEMKLKQELKDAQAELATRRGTAMRAFVEPSRWT